MVRVCENKDEETIQLLLDMYLQNFIYREEQFVTSLFKWSSLIRINSILQRYFTKRY